MYSRILVPTDGSETAERGVGEAIRLAGALRCPLVVLHVVGDFALAMESSSALSFEETMKGLRDAGQEIVDRAAARAKAAGVACEPLVKEGHSRGAAQVIVDEASAQGCDLIVMGTHGRRGLARLALGSDAEGVLRAAGVPVVLVRQPA